MPWQSVPRANFMFLHAARLQAHYAAQWLAPRGAGLCAGRSRTIATPVSAGTMRSAA